MDHLLLFFYLLHICIGAAGVGAASVLHYRLRGRATAALFIVLTVYFCILLFQLVQYYQDILQLPGAEFLILRYVLSFALGIGLYVSVGVLLHRTAALGTTRVVLLTGMVLFVQVLRLAAVVAAADLYRRILHYPSTLIISAYLFYLGFLFSRRQRNSLDPTLSWILSRFGNVLMVFGPLSALFYWIRPRITVLSALPLSLDYMVLVLLSIVTLAGLLRHLTRADNAVTGGEIPQQFMHAFSISPREGDIIKGINEGLGNKEIAERLHISLSTVRTHIYHVFQKSGAKNRVDLLKIMNSYR